MKRGLRGFTLVELMIVLAIVGILAGIAYPSYREQVLKSHRLDAEGALVGLSSALVRYYSDNNSYCDGGGAGGTAVTHCGGTGNDTGKPEGVGYPTTSPSTGTAYYDLTISDISGMTSGSPRANAFTLSATPRAGSPQADDPCGTLTLTSAGVKGQSGTSPGGCW